MSDSSPSDTYKVSFTGHVKTKMRSLLKKAFSLGIGGEVSDLLKDVVKQLAEKPIALAVVRLETGPPGFVECVARYKMMFLWYLVSENRKSVILCDVVPATGHPLAANSS